MINDKDLIFSDDQNAFSTDSTVNSTNDLDLGVANPNMGAGNKKVVRASVGTVAFTGGTSVKVTLYESADDSTYVVLLDSVAVAVASAIVGKLLAEFVLPSTHKRYLRLVYTCVGAVSAGKIDAYLNITG